MFAWSSSHCPLFPYAAGSAPRVTQRVPVLLQPVRGTEPDRTAREALAIVMSAFGRIVWLIRCRPAAKQKVEPAGRALITDCASWPGLITTPLQEPATAGPALLSPTTGWAGPAGLAVCFGLGALAVVDGTGFFVGRAVVGLLETAAEALVVGLMRGIPEPAADFCSRSPDLPSDAAFFR